MFGDFPSFDRADRKWSKLPCFFLNTLAVVKVILSILRHTRGLRKLGRDSCCVVEERVRGRNAG